MVRIFRCDQSESQSSVLQSDLLTGFIQFELIAGAFFLMVGGFVLRVQDTYVMIVIGGTLFSLGLFRMWQRSDSAGGSGVIEDDRVLRVIRHRLNPNYTVALNYSLPDGDRIPYLIMGPPGVFVIDTWAEDGTVREGDSDREWVVTREEEGSDSDDETETTLENPVARNERRLGKLRSAVDKPGLMEPLHNYVIVVGRRADDPPLQTGNVIEMNDLAGILLTDDESRKRLSWEDVDDLEHMLDLKK